MFLLAAFDQLFSCVVSDVDFIASNDRMIDKWWTRMDIKGTCLRLIAALFRDSPRGTQGNHKTWVRTTETPAEIRTTKIVPTSQCSGNSPPATVATEAFLLCVLEFCQYLGLVMSECSVNDNLWTGKDSEGDKCGSIDVLICLKGLTEPTKHLPPPPPPTTPPPTTLPPHP